MKKYLGKKKILNTDGKMIAVRHAADLMKLSTGTVDKMFKKGLCSMSDMLAYRKEIEGKPKPGGAKPKIYKTSRGDLTIQQIVECHPHDLASSAINYRGQKWGFDHKCLWIKKMSGLAFYNAAVSIDGPPRGKDAEKVYENRVEVDNRFTPQQKINRTKCCFRGSGLTLKKCVNYAKRLKMLEGYPEECLPAKGDSCPNYIGIKVTPARRSTDSYTKRYSIAI